MQHRSITGTVLYTSRKPHQLGVRRGIEHFRFTRHGDGAVTLRAYCEIEEPEPTVLRDVVYSLDASGRPADCLLRLTVGDRFMGSGWFRFSPTQVECESYGPSIGRVSQTIELDAPLDGFGTHPIFADGYLLACGEWVVGQRKKLHLLVPSPDHRGATAPLLAKVRIDALYVGCETVEVRAGRFEARHFQFLDDGASGMSGQHPPYDLWVTDDPDGIFLQGGVGGYMQTWYELIALER
jgi:hypothetical protein